MFTFCMARWARQKKQKEKKATKIPKTKWRKYGMNETKDMGELLHESVYYVWGSLFHNHSTALDVIISFLSTAENKTTLIFQHASTAWQLNSELKSFVLLAWRHRHLKKIDSVARYLIIYFLFANIESKVVQIISQ